VLVRKDGTRIECSGPFLLMNGKYSFREKDGTSRSLAADEVDTDKTKAANAEAVAKSAPPPTIAVSAAAENVGVQSREQCGAVVDQLVEAEYIKPAVSLIAARMEQEMRKPLPADVNPEVSRIAVNAARSAFAPNKLMALLRQKFVQSCDLQAFQDVIAGRTSALGAKMTGMQLFSMTAEGERQTKEYLRTMAQHQPTAQRVVLVQRMNDNSEAGDFVTDMTAAIQRGFGPVARGSTRDQQSLKRFLQQTTQTVNVMDMLFTYRNATDEELAEFASMLESPSFKAWDSISRKAFVEVLEQQTKAMANEIRYEMTPR
jgi:hypothetical protein